MPVRKVKGGYRWGSSGKLYPTQAQAERQGRAIYASGYADGGIASLKPEATYREDAQLIPELQEYLSPTVIPYQGEEYPTSPERRSSKAPLLERALSMTEQEQREFLASLQMGDIEFQMAISPYMPSGSEIDPSRANFVPLQEEAGIGPQGLTLKGLTYYHSFEDDPVTGVERILPYAPKYKTYKDKSGVTHKIGPFPGSTVSAVGIGAVGSGDVWAHEYRHWEGTDWDGIFGEEKGFPYFIEGEKKVGSYTAKDWETTFGNTLLDVLAAQTKDDWARNVNDLSRRVIYKMKRDYKGREKDMSAQEDYKEAYRVSKDTGAYTYGETDDFNLKKSGEFVRKVIEQLPEEIAQALLIGLGEIPKRNTLLYDGPSPSILQGYGPLGEPLKNYGPDKIARGPFVKAVVEDTTVEMPEDYRQGGRVRLI